MGKNGKSEKRVRMGKSGGKNRGRPGEGWVGGARHTGIDGTR